jgi:hypothetical protein
MVPGKTATLCTPRPEPHPHRPWCEVEGVPTWAAQSRPTARRSERARAWASQLGPGSSLDCGRLLGHTPPCDAHHPFDLAPKAGCGRSSGRVFLFFTRLQETKRQRPLFSFKPSRHPNRDRLSRQPPLPGRASVTPGRRPQARSPRGPTGHHLDSALPHRCLSQIQGALRQLRIRSLAGGQRCRRRAPDFLQPLSPPMVPGLCSREGRGRRRQFERPPSKKGDKVHYTNPPPFAHPSQRSNRPTLQQLQQAPPSRALEGTRERRRFLL